MVKHRLQLKVFLKLLAVGNKIEYFSGEWKFIKTLKINSQFKKENENFRIFAIS